MRVVLLCLALTGCATAPVTVKLTPPADLLQECGPVVEQTVTNGQLAATILEYRKVLRLCNNDKAALREWSEKE